MFKNKRITKALSAILAFILMMSFFQMIGSAETTPTYSLGCLTESIDPAKVLPPIDQSQLAGLPPSVDLSLNNCPPVGNQGSQGSCVGWAVGYAYKTYQEKIERNWSVSATDHQFSPAYIYNQIVQGNDGGAYTSDAFDLLVNQGCAALADMPYNQEDYKTKPTSAQKTAASKYKALSWNYLQTGSISDIKAALASGNAVVASIRVYTSFDKLTPSNPIQTIVSGVYRGNHAICVVGYNDANSTLKILNSWGTGWGASGYGYIQYDVFQTINNALYVMTDVIDVTGVKLNKSSSALKIGESEKLTVAVTPSNATYNTVTWSSSDTAVATVDSTGKVTAKATGTATITAKTSDAAGTKTAACVYTVTPEENTTFDGALPIYLNTPVSVNVTAANQKRYYVFTAPATGSYTFASSSCGNYDPYGWLYNSSKSQIAYNDDSSGTCNFAITYALTSGQKYYIAGGCYGAETGAYTLTVTGKDLPSDNIANGIYNIHPKLSPNRVLDIPNQWTQNGVQAMIYEKQSNNPNQQFKFERLNDETYRITPVHSGKPLEVRNSRKDDGAPVSQWDLHEYSCQRWYIYKCADGNYKFINKNSGMALDLNDGKTDNWTYMVQWTDNGSDSQRFTLNKLNISGDYIPNGVYNIQSKSSPDKFIHIPDGRTENGVRAVIHKQGDKTANQRFRFERLNDGAYKITPIHSLRPLEVGGNRTENGAAVIQYYWGGSDTYSYKRWYVYECSDGYYKFINKHSGKALDVSGADTGYDETFIVQRDDNGTNKQMFNLIKLSTDILPSDNIPDGTYNIESKSYPGKVFDIPYELTENGIQPTIHQKGSNSSNQQFKFERLSDGTYKITPVHSGRPLEVGGSYSENGGTIIQYDWSDSYSCKRWYVYKCADGNYKFINKSSGKALDIYSNADIYNASADTRPVIIQWVDNGNDSQRFKLNKV